MKEIDLTGEKFDFLELSEGNLFYDSFSEGEQFHLRVYGATLMKELDFYNKDVYIPSFSDLIFDDVKYISMYYGIYANEIGNKFVKNFNGDSTEMWLKLGKNNDLCEYSQYVTGGILGRNFGYGELTIYCKGKIKFTYDEKTVIDATKFVLNPNKYRIESIYN
ncbi:MAG: hypothetical protein K6G26_00275 [Lachnospiraceae bacterium]|jgi:hypothetical protein|nr:hypothetical protein [Lachnospiraceae bacterium]